MPPSLLEIPPLIFRCSLNGVAPLQGSTNWSKEAIDYFSKFIEDPFHADRGGADLTLFVTNAKGLAEGAKGLSVYQARIESKGEKSFVAKKMIEKGLVQAIEQ